MSGVPIPNTQAMFYEQFEAVRRDEVVGILLALFLGTFGVHHFYLRRTGLGILYCCFFWTGIPSILGFIECFFMPSRVREFNAIQAAGIAAALGMTVPQGWGWPVNVTVNVPPAGTAAAPVPALASMPLAGAQLTCRQCQRTNVAGVAGSKFCSGCGSAL
jgi:TM2 domain-containing membrane protein YozV